MAVSALSAAKRPSRISLLFAAVVRVLFTTLLFAAGGMGLGLLLGILGTFAWGMIHGGHIDMRNAYRLVAIPMAATFGVIAFAGSIYLEVRDKRTSRLR
jgi:hypothetical protein